MEREIQDQLKFIEKNTESLYAYIIGQIQANLNDLIPNLIPGLLIANAPENLQNLRLAWRQANPSQAESQMNGPILKFLSLLSQDISCSTHHQQTSDPS